MSSSRNNTPSHQEFAIQSLFTAAITHGPRIKLNMILAGEQGEFFIRTLRAWPNLGRGFFTFWCQNETRKAFPAHTCAATVLSGMAVSAVLETPSIAFSNADPKLPKPTLKQVPFLRSSVLLGYGIRELGFTWAVFGREGATPLENNAWFTLGVIISTIGYRGAVWRITMGLPRTETVTQPRWDVESGRAIINNLAHGRYTSPTFKPLFANPSSALQRAGNLANALCPPQALAGRLIYMGIFKAAKTLTSPENQRHAREAISGLNHQKLP